MPKQKQEEISAQDPKPQRRRLLFVRLQLIVFALAMLAVATVLHEVTHQIVYLEYGVRSSITFEGTAFRTIPNVDDLQHLSSINVYAAEDLRMISSEIDVQAYQIEYPIFILIFMIYMLIVDVNSRGR